LGTVELGMDYGIDAPGGFGRPSEEAAIRIVHTALDHGINFIDTARAYGESEAVLGKALCGRRDGVVLTTKVGTRLPDGALPSGAELRKHMLAQLDTSLRHLQTDWVDLWQLHTVDRPELAQIETIAGVLAEAQQTGKVRFVGGSFYGTELPLAALALDLFDTLQVTFSVFDQRMTGQVFPQAHRQTIGIMARSVLLKGALTARAEHLPDHLEPLRAQSRRFRALVNEMGPGWQPAQAALAFALAQPQISSVLVGVRSLAELRDNLAALHTPLPPAWQERFAALRLDDEALLNPATWGIP
jgi:aryl-alcohol dehydrogenase-like predicted oxidoreductase